jgi:hypothetical protein
MQTAPRERRGRTTSPADENRLDRDAAGPAVFPHALRIEQATCKRAGGQKWSPDAEFAGERLDLHGERAHERTDLGLRESPAQDEFCFLGGGSRMSTSARRIAWSA